MRIKELKNNVIRVIYNSLYYSMVLYKANKIVIDIIIHLF